MAGGSMPDAARVPFRRRDVTAAIKAVEAAGYTVARIEISPDGRIVVIPRRPDETALPSGNEWDEILEGAP
jgi:hypothetical protein